MEAAKFIGKVKHQERLLRMLKMIGKRWAGQRVGFLVNLLQGSILGKTLNLETTAFHPFLPVSTW